MDTSTFWKELLQHIEWPFSIEEVEKVESNGGSTWIDLKNGDTYYISLGKVENESALIDH